MKKKLKYTLPLFTGILVVLLIVGLPMLFEGDQLVNYLLYSVRFVLILYIFFTINHHFTTKLKYEGEFQKIMYKGVVLSILFACFTTVGLLINFYLNPQSEDYSLSQAWLVQTREWVKIGLLYSVFMVIWIHFHPNNKVRLRNKAARLAKAQLEREAEAEASTELAEDENKDK